MFRVLDLKSAIAFGLLPGAWTEFDFDCDEGAEAPSPDDVKFMLELQIGTREESWAETFSVLVVTPNNRPGRTPHTRFLALPRYSHAVLKGHVFKALAASQRDSWEESLLELRKRFFWEWEST